MEEITYYNAFGLDIKSEINLPELKKAKELREENDTIILDLTIQKRDLSTRWKEVSGSNNYFFMQENMFLFNVPNVAIFLVENGERIVVSPTHNSSEDQIRLYLLGTCMGVLFMQRKILPLHGSAIDIDGKAFAIVGHSGAGKSTLASAFIMKGFQLVSDDVIPVTFNDGGFPVVTPAYPQQKLWLESLDEFGIESKNFRPIIDREKKFAIPVGNNFSTKLLPLEGVIELVKTKHDEIEINQIHNLQRLQTLYRHTYRNVFIESMGLMEWHFKTSAKLCKHIKMYQLQRPITRFTAHELTDYILEKVKKGEEVYG
ncbi:aldolase [Metabacillus litoralis]|uniref:aldolase n=1 Tax=Metabacillus litoralis TaxID=152268 RepID=UPI001CFF072F|nr:aldolase [Metabacillus litoralis]